ncbi:hypothetical protein [Streptomyces sp. NPDC001404]|uniref:hypothetical protein n=1 Tax=Streptomyces sp. NPDC001404 TaxID=3364571 RepID=UPI00367828C6
MSREDRELIGKAVTELNELMHRIVSKERPLIPESLRGDFSAALQELDQRQAFDEVMQALLLEEGTADEEAATEREERLEESLNRVGLLGQQLTLKKNVYIWARDPALSALQHAEVAGWPEGAEPDDNAEVDASTPSKEPDPKWLLWKRARKLLVKLLKIIDDFFKSLIRAIHGVGELILEVKQAMEAVLDR